MGSWRIAILLLGVQLPLSFTHEGSGYTSYGDDEDSYSHRHTATPWCAPIKVKHGHASCRPPRGEYYKNVMGTRCKIHCNKGYEVHGHPELLCMANRRWSGNYVCREIRCPELTMPANGGYKCTDGAYFNSRCEYFCSPGYTQRGDRTVTCMSNKHWSGGSSACVDLEPPKIKCPSVRDKTADPGKLTVRVIWDTPEGKDTADGILTDVTLKGKPPGTEFPEGDHKISYTVLDRAGNKGTCRFSIRVRVRRCDPINPPENGYVKCDSDGNNYGATCEFSCMRGYDLQGSAARVCQYGLTWSGSDTTCSPMNINVGVRSAADLLDQFYEKRRVLIVSAPAGANHDYKLQMRYLQTAQCGLDLRHVTVVELIGVYPAQIGRIRDKFLSPRLALQTSLLLQISQKSFNMVLLDMQGTDKARYPFPITAAELFTTIDTFPQRKDEMILQQQAGHSCQS